jgi:glycosyltransferase involved in cell wall biosynthesis
MSRILFVVERFPPEIGGLARSGHRIASTLARQGHRVDVFSLSSQLENGRARSEMMADNLTLHRFGKAKSIDFSMQQATIFLQWLHQQDPKGQPFDVVWSHYAFHLGFLGTWFAKQHRVRSILAVRGNDVDRQVFPPGDLSRLQWSLQNASQVVSVSHDLAAKIETIANVKPIVLYNSVDAELFCPGNPNEELKAKYEIRNDHLVLIFTGELRAKKGLAMLIDCFRQLASKRPVKLLIVGEIRRQDLGRFQRDTANLDKAAVDIVCTGHLSELSDVAEHLRLADVFVLPSLWDGLPNSMLEAMSVGIPVVASDAGAIGEVIVDGKNGILIPRYQLHQMADRIEHFLSKPAAERNEMTDAAMQTVRANHSPALEENQLAQIISN